MPEPLGSSHPHLFPVPQAGMTHRASPFSLTWAQKPPPSLSLHCPLPMLTQGSSPWSGCGLPSGPLPPASANSSISPCDLKFLFFLFCFSVDPSSSTRCGWGGGWVHPHSLQPGGNVGSRLCVSLNGNSDSLLGCLTHWVLPLPNWCSCVSSEWGA